MLKMSPLHAPGRNTVDAAGRQQLLLENLAEVRHIARRIHERVPAHVCFDDLVHSGILGLIAAVDKFDPRRNVRLKSYARFRIRGAILDSLRQTDWSPRSLRRKKRRLERANHELTGELGRPPSMSEIACRVGLPVEELQQLLGEFWGSRITSLPVWSDEGPEEKGLPKAFRQDEDPYQMAFRTEIRHLLGEALSELDAKEREVVSLYYLEEFTMKETGEVLGIGESRVSQIHAAALIHLRSHLVIDENRKRYAPR